MKTKIAALSFALLSGCSTYNAHTYSVSADTNYAIKSFKSGEVISIGDFAMVTNFDNSCRAVGPISLPNNLTYQAYFKKAFEDELKIAGAYAYKDPKIILSGRINKLEMSSSKGLTRGYWSINLTVTSSNGQSLTSSEYYEFESGFDGFTACKNTADGFMPAVQNLIGKIIRDPQFKGLIQASK